MTEGQKQGYKDLIAWQKGMELVKSVYILTKFLPNTEQFILIPQILRAVISIPSNIAEGWSRNRKLEFIRFLEIAYASSCELETQILICEAQYPNINYSTVRSLIVEVQKILFKLIKNAK